MNSAPISSQKYLTLSIVNHQGKLLRCAGHINIYIALYSIKRKTLNKNIITNKKAKYY